MAGTGRRGAARPWSTGVPTREEQREVKRRALVHEAGLAFRRKGFHETSLDDIAAALGVTKAALYRYVKDKYELLYECHLVAMDLGDAALEHGRASGRNGLERAVLTLEKFIVGYISENSAGAAIVNIDALRDEHRAEIVRRRDRFDQGLREFIREGIADGSVEPCDPRIATFAIMGAINWLPRWFRPDGALSGEAVARQLIMFFVQGLRSDASRGRPA